jgi:hypothetical protein
VLLFAHGNGELIDHWPAEFDEPRSWGMAVLLVEYPGYGRSAGFPAQPTIAAAMAAAYDWIRTQPSLDANRIIATAAPSAAVPSAPCFPIAGRPRSSSSPPSPTRAASRAGTVRRVCSCGIVRQCEGAAEVRRAGAGAARGAGRHRASRAWGGACGGGGGGAAQVAVWAQ